MVTAPVRVVFLDFDGVLNSHAFVASLSPEKRTSIIGIDRAAVARLNDLLRVTGALVVVSSTWRMRRTTTQLQQVLDDHGFLGRVIGRTPSCAQRVTSDGPYLAHERGFEIQEWLDKAPDYGIDVAQFVILDDDSDMAHLADRLVKTSFDDGLQERHVERAIAMVTEPRRLIVLPPEWLR